MIRATKGFQVNFNSASEYACAVMLEKYANWRPIPGVTIEIKVGRTLFDFRVDDVFIEYHPISLRRECLTDSLGKISSIIHVLPKDRRVEVLKAICEELEAQYAKRRAQILSVHQTYKDMELICSHSPEDFIKKVLSRFAGRNCPESSEALREFRKLQKEFKKR